MIAIANTVVQNLLLLSLFGHSIRQSAGPAFKAALAHSWTHDTLDSHIMASKGALLRFTNELAVTKRIIRSLFPSPYPTSGNISGESGVGEDTTAFWKVEGEAKRGWALTRSLVSGLVAPLMRRGH